ncbi:CD209 antigen-like protein C [Equus caballus]|uniref:C-type lectin domain-containing protein n=1 Tax=Equus caballus TaxID=9796 RepID=A0A9L0TNX4_HORSE|nr:CD209 antigen-like protein E [Equus caballus]
MAEMCGLEETYENQKLTEKEPRQLWSSRGSPGCRTRLPLLLLPLLLSLGLFLLLITILIQVSKIHQSMQRGAWDHQENEPPVAVSPERIQSELEEIREQLTRMNATLTGLCRPCPWNWGFFQGSCYFFSQTQNTWKASVSACQDIKAQLVIIDSAEEQQFLKFWDTRNNRPAWIGLSDHHNEGSWLWVDNTPVNLSFWKEGEPNNHGDEDCVDFYSDGWNDDKCNRENFFICEKPSVPCPEF